ncbi:alpha/beta fold hydrolase [Flavobacterium sp. Sd200]|uniref:alpha/beta fold hydrolase n=1 Tax=Flavobacterium sp. Sd200 TaxID=2692211 RepID=UPI00136A4CB6|nr:alpha/beta hydrolase [Flavobacterium sp. Sd200]MXN90227.1 alpha/beta fold hydrolase [Flavobacterium sp. Sd200]
MIRKHLILIASSMLLLSCTAAKDKSTNELFLNKKAENKYISAYNNTMKLWPVPYEEKDITTTYGNAHIIISGPKDGKPLVLLHGMDASSTMWYPNIGSYAKHYRVYCIDYLTEAGKSIKNEDAKFNPDDITPWYTQIFDALKLKKFDLVAASRGGWVATNYALKCDGRIKKMVLLAPVQTFEGINMQSKTMTAANFKFFPTRKRLNKMVAYFSEKPEKVSHQFKEQMYLGTKNTKTKMDLLHMKPFSDKELKSLTLPVLVLVGDNDILNKPEITEKAKELLPNCKTEIIKDAGHFLTMDQQEKVDATIIKFLESK